MKKIYLLAVVLLSTMLMNAAPCKHYIVNTGNWEGTPYQVLYDTISWATSYAEMTLEADSINGYSVFSYTIDPDTCSVNGFQFTDAAKAAWVPTKAVAIDSLLNMYFYDGAWYEKKDIPSGPVTKKYYIIGDVAELGAWKDFLLMDGDSIIINLAMGTTATFLVYPGTDWTGGIGYTNINAECSSTGYEAGPSNNSIVVTMSDDSGLKVKVVNDELCVIGSFGKPVMSSYTVVGDLAILGGTKAWNETDTINDMTFNAESGDYELEKIGMYLTEGSTYEYRVVGNHGWAFMFPDANQTTEAITETGWYDIVFSFNVEANALTSMIYPGEEPSGLKPVNASEQKVTKIFQNGQLIILKNNVPYSVIGTQL